MTDRGHSQLRQLLTGSANLEAVENGTNMAAVGNSSLYHTQDGSAVNSSSGSNMTTSNSLQDLVGLGDGETANWFNSLPTNDFFGGALLSQDEEQFGFGNIAMDDFTDQVLKASGNNTELDSWIEANLPEHMTANQPLPHSSSNQSFQLNEPHGSMPEQLPTELTSQQYYVTPSSSSGLYPYGMTADEQSQQSANIQQSYKMPLTVATSLTSTMLSTQHQEHSLQPANCPGNHMQQASNACGPALTSPADVRHSSYIQQSEQIISPDGSFSSSCSARRTYPNTSTAGISSRDTVYVAEQRESVYPGIPLTQYDSPSGYEDFPKLMVASPSQLQKDFDPGVQQNHPHLQPSPYIGQEVLSPNKQSLNSMQHIISPNQRLASPNPGLGGNGNILSPRLSAQSGVSNDTTPSDPQYSNLEYSWQNANQWQTPKYSNPVSGSDQWLSINQPFRVSTPHNPSTYSTQHTRVSSSNSMVQTNQNNVISYSTNQMSSNVQFAAREPNSPMASQGSTMLADSSQPLAARRQNTEQSLKDCGLYEAAMLTKRLSKRDKDISAGLDDFKYHLTHFMQSLSIQDA